MSNPTAWVGHSLLAHAGLGFSGVLGDSVLDDVVGMVSFTCPGSLLLIPACPIPLVLMFLLLGFVAVILMCVLCK